MMSNQTLKTSGSQFNKKDKNVYCYDLNAIFLMRNQFIKALFVLAAICSALQVQAQLRVGPNIGIGLPNGDFGSYSKVGFGAGLSAEYLLLDKHIGLGINAGVTSFGYKGNLGLGGHSTIVPFTASAKYYLGSQYIKPFIGLDLGAYRFSDSQAPGASKFNPGLAPQGGFVFLLSDHFDVNLTAKYNLMFSNVSGYASTLTFLALNLGVAYTFGK